MIDKPALMSREEIAGWADCILGNPSALTENTRERQEFGEIVKAALAAHDIYDKAIEDAAQILEDLRIPLDRDNDGSFEFWRFNSERAAEQMRKLKGTSNA